MLSMHILKGPDSNKTDTGYWSEKYTCLTLPFPVVTETGQAGFESANCTLHSLNSEHHGQGPF